MARKQPKLAAGGIVLSICVFVVYLAYLAPAKPVERLLVDPHAPLPPMDTNKFDIFGEHPKDPPPPALSEEEFRRRFRDTNLQELLRAGTLDNTRRTFGEPLEYYSDRIYYTRDELPAWFAMKFPTGAVLAVTDGFIVAISIKDPAISVQNGLHVGASIDEMYLAAGTPAEIEDISGQKRQLGVEAGSGKMRVYGLRKVYSPKNTNLCIWLEEDKVTTLSFSRYLPRPERRLYSPSPPWPISKPPWTFWHWWTEGPECRRRLEQFGTAVMTSAVHSKSGFYPVLPRNSESIRFPNWLIVPEYTKDPRINFCPAEGSGTASSAQDFRYCFFPYCMTNEREGMAFLAGFFDAVMTGKPLDEDLVVPLRALGGTMGKLYRLGEGTERLYVYETGNSSLSAYIQSVIPIAMEMPGNHHHSGGHVLYMDGHAEWLPYPSHFPMTKGFVEGIQALEDRLHNESHQRTTDGH